MKFIHINVIESLTNTNEIHPYEETEILFLIFLIRMNYVRIYKLNPLTYINNQTKTMKSNSINGEKDETYLDGGAAPKCSHHLVILVDMIITKAKGSETPWPPIIPQRW